MSGYEIMAPNTRKDWTGLDLTKTWYISAVALLGGDKIKVVANSVHLINPNMMVGFSKSGYFEFVALDPNRSWRAKAGNGS